MVIVDTSTGYDADPSSSGSPKGFPKAVASLPRAEDAFSGSDLLRPASHLRIHTIKGARALMSTHLFPAHMTYRHGHDNPRSFLTVAGAVLAVLVILIALAFACAAA